VSEMGKSAKVLALAAVTVLLAAACSNSSTSNNGNSLTPVSLRLDWFFGSEHAPYFVALDKGYFRQAGLDVDILEGSGSSTALKLVANGSNTFGIVGAGTVLTGASEEIPIKAVAAIFQETPGAICYDKKTWPLDSLTDMYGGRLADDPSSVSHNEWEAVAALNNVDTSKIANVAIKAGSDAQVMLTHKVDFDNCWTINQGVEMQLKGLDVGYLRFPDLGLHIPGSSLITNDATISKNPDMVRAFVQAVIKGWTYTLEHPDEALKILFDHEPHIDANYNTIKMPLVLDLVESPNGVGYMDPAAWQNLEKVYLDTGVISNSIDISKVFTNQFVSSSSSPSA
jgi:NitT/TauT family transport system substrate-binding protein